MKELEKIYNFHEVEEDNTEQEFIKRLDKFLTGESLTIWLLLRQGLEEREIQKVIGVSYYQFRNKLKQLSKDIKKYGDNIGYR
jgi:hypothetical protein